MRKILKTVGVDGDISVEEPIRFVLETKDGDDCLINPYRIDSVTVYFVSREFTDVTANSYQMVVENERAVREYEEARDVLCSKKKDPVGAATTSEITLSGLQTVDGIALDEGARVLVKDQADATQNGIYIASSSAWKRSDDARSFMPKSYVFVEEGIANIGSGWYLESGRTVVVGSTPLTFVRFSDNGDPASPDAYSETRVAQLKKIKSDSASKSDFYYKDAAVVKTFGGVQDRQTGELFPAWLNPDMVSSELRDKVAGDNILTRVYEGDEPATGKFELVWDPSGCREGDYFVCWSWRPTLSGETMSAHLYFSLGGGVGLTSSIPTHRTDPKKYNMLMARYLPDMFENFISENDLSPLVLKGLNESVAAGFTMIENLANQIIDLLDSNATHEQLLPLLSNMFALKVKSSDSTLWRRQIKKAIPNFKKKGTIVGLREAYGDAGMKLLRLARLWQVVSEYTHQESFTYEDSNTFPLSKAMILPVDSNFELWFRPAEGQWQDVTSSHGVLAGFDGSNLVWNGTISKGDSVRVLYKTKEIPSSRQALEDYIRGMPLMDNRDERGQQYPPKNWNVRVVEEDDPMFGVLVPVRHPLADPVVWGRVRTEFPYSENAYNMDEYNGSKRDSLDPCDIDKDFVDSCGSCQASVFNIDLEVEGLSDAGFAEAMQVAEENMPFHSMVHTYNLSGSRTEFVGPLEERIETLVTVSGGETLIAGEAQHIFNRSVDASQVDDVRRDILASFEAVEAPGGGTTWGGVLRNSRVCLFPSSLNSESDLNEPDTAGLSQGFGQYNIDTSSPDEDPFESGNLLELLGSTARYHTLSSIDLSAAEIYGEVDPSTVGPLFEYRISNKVADITVDIVQSDRVVFSDEDADFYLVGIVSQKDVDDEVAPGPAWTLRFESSEYKVLDLLPDGTLLLEEAGAVPSLSGWQLWAVGEQVASGPGGSKAVKKMGLVEVVSALGVGARSLIRLGDYLYIGWGSTPSRHKVRSYKAGEELFYIEDYEGGGAGGVDAKVYRRVIESRVGQVGYDGLVLDSDADLESELPISNGLSANVNEVNSDFLRENYLIFIGSEYYTILHVDGSSAILGGRLDSYTKDGQEVDFTVYRFSKQGLTLRERVEPRVPSFDFDFVDRSGKALIKSTQAVGGMSVLSSRLNSANSGQPFDTAAQDEQIEFTVEYRDGEET